MTLAVLRSGDTEQQTAPGRIRRDLAPQQSASRGQPAQARPSLLPARGAALARSCFMQTALAYPLRICLMTNDLTITFRLRA